MPELNKKEREKGKKVADVKGKEKKKKSRGNSDWAL